MLTQMPGRPGGGGHGGGLRSGPPPGGRGRGGHPPPHRPPPGRPPPRRIMGGFFDPPRHRRRPRRLRWGDFILFGLAGSPLAWRFSPWELARIEAHYGMQAEMLSEVQILGAMQALNIQSATLNAEQQAKMQELDNQDVEDTPATGAQPSPVSNISTESPGTRKFCPSCGCPVTDSSARFCERCGIEFH